ncbi:MAG TPA: TonB-dependent receptor plug domain-containing protein [Gemmatimonadaceae bacterium]
MSTRSRRAPVVLSALVVALAACHTGGQPPSLHDPLAGDVITATAIANSDARNAWEVLQHNGRFTLDETASGEPVRVASHRGRGSIIFADSDTPLIYVDGAQLLDIRVLRQIPAESIQSIRILSGIEGTTYYGTNAGAGVIVIRTKAGP